MPIPHPALEKAKGPASRPEPKEDFIKLAHDRKSLKIIQNQVTHGMKKE